jgi:hypothetical protein
MHFGTDEIVTTDKTAYLQQQGLMSTDSTPPPVVEPVDTTRDTFVPVTGSGFSVAPSGPNFDSRTDLLKNLSAFNVFALPKGEAIQPDRTWMYAAGALAVVAVAALALKRG